MLYCIRKPSFILRIERESPVGKIPLVIIRNSRSPTEQNFFPILTILTPTTAKERKRKTEKEAEKEVHQPVSRTHKKHQNMSAALARKAAPALRSLPLPMWRGAVSFPASASRRATFVTTSTKTTTTTPTGRQDGDKAPPPTRLLDSSFSPFEAFRPGHHYHHHYRRTHYQQRAVSTTKRAYSSTTARKLAPSSAEQVKKNCRKVW